MGRPCLCVKRASGQVNGALVSSWEHSVSLFFSVRSLTRPVNLSLSVSFSFLSWVKLFPRCFDLVSPHFQLPRFALSPSSNSVSCPISFFSSSSAFSSFPAFLSLSLPLVCSFFYLFSLSLRQSVGEERTDLFKISKDRSCWSLPFY